jgi:uncharacterized membrane protein YphA (DoxX/SURF4 family)
MLSPAVSPYVLAFCRVVIGVVFLVSSANKVIDFPRFKEAVLAFRLLPGRLSSSAAFLFLCSEVAVVVLLVLGGSFLLPGFALAIGLLSLFCFALVTVVIRRIRTACHCFSPSTKAVSFVDVWRNLGFIVCALVGCLVLTWTKVDVQIHMNPLEWLFMGLGGVALLVIWTQLGEITQLFRQL